MRPLSQLKELAGFKSLQAIILNNAGVSDANLKELAEFKSLQTLDLHSCREVTDAGLKELAGLTSLRALYLGSTKVTDAGLKDLASGRRRVDFLLDDARSLRNRLGRPDQQRLDEFLCSLSEVESRL